MEPRSANPPAPTVDELMTSAVVTVDPNDTVGKARDLMARYGIHGLPVVDTDGEVVGLVTSSDLVEEWPAGESVDTVMARPVRSIAAEAGAPDAAATMLEHRIHHLLVVQGDRPVGVVTSFDLLRALVPPPTDDGGPTSG